jgi:hypothetical protein
MNLKRNWPLLGVLLVTGVTLLSGVIHGRVSGRWHSLKELQAAAERLKEVPAEFGPWRMKSSQEMGVNELQILQCAGFIRREYVNRQTGEVVHVVVIVGPTGPTSVHRPEVCYSSRDHVVVDQRREAAMPGDAGDRLWATTFQSQGLDAGLLRVYYGWSPGDRWSAPEEARREFAGRPYLYKIQVESQVSTSEIKQSDPCYNFLKDFLPVANRCLEQAVSQ